MAKLKIAIVISTTRATRFGHKPAQWVKDIAAQRDDIETEIVDLRDFPMPFFDEVASNAWVPSQNEVAQRWQKKVAEFDGYIFVTAEYNHGIPAVLKNALDYAYPEWNKKAAGFVGYGGGRRRARGRAIAPGRGRAANGDHPHRCLYPGRRLHGGVEGRQGAEGHHLPAGRRQRHAGSTGLVDRSAQDRARPGRSCRGRRNLHRKSLHRGDPTIMSIRPVKNIIESKPDHGGRRRASAPRLRLRRHHGVRSVPAVRRFPQRQSRRVHRRLSLASASRHRDDHLRPGRRASITATASATAACWAPATCSG